MYILSDLAKAAEGEKLRVGALHRRQGRAYAARRAGNRGGPARRLADLRIQHGRRSAQAY